ncbi:hypothetical protein [Devosia soli]|nr:hypothetical protein [Devosia soli]
MTNRAKGWAFALLLTLGLWLLALSLAFEGELVVGSARQLGGHLLKMIG